MIIEIKKLRASIFECIFECDCFHDTHLKNSS